MRRWCFWRVIAAAVRVVDRVTAKRELLRRITMKRGRQIQVSLMAVGVSMASLLVCGVGCGEGSLELSPPPRPNLVLIVIDTLRADHLGAYGYPLPTSPNIDRLAARGTLFENATAPSSWTRPSIGSLFTSRHPSEHGATAFDRALNADLPTLAGRLRAAGYRTVGVSGNFVHVNEATGLARGFDDWQTISIRLADANTRDDSILTLHVDDGDDIELRAPRADEVNEILLAKIPPAADTPLFLYVHYTDPHAGYLAADQFREAFVSDDGSQASLPAATSDYVVELASRKARLNPAELRRLTALYDAEIAAVDAAIGELIDVLAQRGYEENTVITVVSDHGEEFGEHDGWFHGLTLHRESVEVPIIFFDSRNPRGQRRTEAVDLLDVPTTLLALAGLEPAPGMRGRDVLGAGLQSERDIIAELHPEPLLEKHLRRRDQRVAVTRWPWKLIVSSDGGRQFYRLDQDRAELHPRQNATGTIPDSLIAKAAIIEKVSARNAAIPGTIELDSETRKGLRALGYAE